MDFADTVEQAAFRLGLRRWLDTNMPKGWAGEESLPADSAERVAFLRTWQRRVHEAGWAGLTWPREYGGQGATLVEQAIFQEEMVRARAPELISLVGLNMLGPTLIAYGTEAQKRRHLEPILSAEELWAQGFSEPDAGSDLASLRSRAVLDGDEWMVDAHKVWTTLGQHARWCELMVRTSTGGRKHDGLTCLIVDMESPGVSVRPIRQINDDTEFSEMFFDGVRVPRDSVLGEVGGGWQIALATLMHERGTLGFAFSARNRVVLDRVVALAKAVTRDGRPAIEDLPLRQRLGQLHIEIESMRLNALGVLSAADRSDGVPGPEGSILKIQWSDTNQRMQELALDLLGPDAPLWGPEGTAGGSWQWGWLRSRANSIEGGTTQILLNIVAERVVRLPKPR